PDGSIRRTLTGVKPPGLAECPQLYRYLLLTRGEKPRDAAWTSLIPVEACRPPSDDSIVHKCSTTTRRVARHGPSCASPCEPPVRAERPACRGASCRAPVQFPPSPGRPCNRGGAEPGSGPFR